MTPARRTYPRTAALAIAATLLGCSLIAYAMGAWMAFFTLAFLGLASGVVGFLAPRKSFQESESIPSLDEVSAPSLYRLKPAIRLRAEILSLLTAHAENPVISAAAADTEREVDDVVLRSCEIVETRKKVQQLIKGVYGSRFAVEELESELAGEKDPEVAKSTQSALTARKAELATLEKLELSVRRLDANLKEAESMLAELKAQIISAAADSSTNKAREELEPFSELTSRLRNLSSTMRESIETVGTGNWA